jgi:hypothetical protein
MVSMQDVQAKLREDCKSNTKNQMVDIQAVVRCGGGAASLLSGGGDIVRVMMEGVSEMWGGKRYFHAKAIYVSCRGKTRFRS